MTETAAPVSINALRGRPSTSISIIFCGGVGGLETMEAVAVVPPGTALTSFPQSVGGLRYEQES